MDLILPLLVLVAACLGLAGGVEPIPTWFFPLLWWPYVLALDAWSRRGGRASLRGRPGGLAWLALASVAWWTLFEAINLRLGNWYYVMSPASRPVRWLAGGVAFATVLPGIMATLNALDGWPRLRAIHVAPLS